MGHKDLRLGQIVYILVFCNMSFSRLLPLDGFQFIFLLRDSENDLFVFGRPVGNMDWINKTWSDKTKINKTWSYIKRIYDQVREGFFSLGFRGSEYDKHDLAPA